MQNEIIKSNGFWKHQATNPGKEKQRIPDGKATDPVSGAGNGFWKESGPEMKNRRAIFDLLQISDLQYWTDPEGNQATNPGNEKS